MNTLPRPLSIVIADDHPVVLHGILGLLQSHSDLKVVATCRDGTTALSKIRELSPDIAVLDITMPGLTGLDVLGAVAREKYPTKIIILTVSAADSQIVTAVANGARAIILKDAAPDDLARCIREVGAGRYWLPIAVVQAAVEREAGRKTEAGHLAVLTARERQVLLLVSEALSNKEVGRRLGLSEGTVKIHLHNIYHKIGVRNRTVLTMFAAAHRDELTARDA